MKATPLIFFLFIGVFFTSCEISSYYYQVYKVTPDDKVNYMGKKMVYEDDNCKVYYDLWGENGDMGFMFFNKTEQNIYLNMEQCFFLLNGIASNYYQNRVFTGSSSVGTNTNVGTSASKSVTGFNYLNLLQTNNVSVNTISGTSSSSGYSVSYLEEKVVCIPSKSSKFIKGYSINNTLLRDCSLLVYPTKNQIKTLSFEKPDSPLIFGNRLEYSIGKSGNPIKFENEFYISEITNYPESEMYETRNDENCNEESWTTSKYFKENPADKFYVKYSSGQISWKH